MSVCLSMYPSLSIYPPSIHSSIFICLSLSSTNKISLSLSPSHLSLSVSVSVHLVAEDSSIYTNSKNPAGFPHPFLIGSLNVVRESQRLPPRREAKVRVTIWDPRLQQIEGVSCFSSLQLHSNGATAHLPKFQQPL